MKYTIKEIADLAGVTLRTLRYYDEIGLLKPNRKPTSGYRIYDQKEVDLLQQILLYRSMDLSLDQIQEIMSNPKFNITEALLAHQEQLFSRRDQLDQLIETVEKTIAYHKGEIKMSNKEKFEGFKKEKLAVNERKHGQEIREKYGEDTIKASNKKFMNLSEDEYNRMQKTEEELFQSLKEVGKTKDLETDSAKNVYDLHKAWLNFSWPSYSVEAHKGLAEMYMADERFMAYYNERAEMEVVEILHDIIIKYAK